MPLKTVEISSTGDLRSQLHPNADDAMNDPVLSAAAISAHSFGSAGVLNGSSVKDGHFSESFVTVGDETVNLERYECRNMVCLSLIFSVYFGFRAGTLVLFPQATKEILSDYLHGQDTSPLYQVPIALWFFVDIFIVVPNAWFMKVYGRRVGFMTGAFVAFLSCISMFIIFLVMEKGILMFICLNVSILGLSLIGVGEFVKYAAAEACPDDARKPIQVSRVITGGAFFSMLGPFGASFAANLDKDNVLHGYAYFFLILSGMALVSCGAASLLRLPSFEVKNAPEVAPLCSIVSRFDVAVAVMLQTIAQFVMLTPMSAAPLAMINSLDLSAGSFLVSGATVVHVLSMFLPGLLTGRLMGAIGRVPTMLAGQTLAIACNIVAVLGYSVGNYYSAMILLGIGWNWVFVASTMLLLASHSLEERTKVSSFNESFRFGGNVLAALASSTWSWTTLGYLCLVMNLAAIILIGVVMFRPRKSTASA